MSEHAGFAPSEKTETAGFYGPLDARKRRRAEDSERKRELRRLGVNRSRRADAGVWLLAGLLTVVATAAVVGVVTHALKSGSAVALAAVGISVAGLLVALLQWRNGLAEKALDALYQRIALANQMQLEAFGSLTDEETVASERELPYKFFVFSEIDSLEYASRRYRLGLGLSAHIFYRAVRHFQTRCRSETFKRVAKSCAEEGGYFGDTKDLVEKLLNPVEQAAKR